MWNPFRFWLPRPLAGDAVEQSGEFGRDNRYTPGWPDYQPPRRPIVANPEPCSSERSGERYHGHLAVYDDDELRAGDHVRTSDQIEQTMLERIQAPEVRQRRAARVSVHSLSAW